MFLCSACHCPSHSMCGGGESLPPSTQICVRGTAGHSFVVTAARQSAGAVRLCFVAMTAHKGNDVVDKAWNVSTVNVTSRHHTGQLAPIFHSLQEDESEIRICDFLSHRPISAASLCGSVQKAQNVFLSQRSIPGSNACSNSHKMVDDFRDSTQRALSEELNGMNHDASKSSTPVKRHITEHPEEHSQENSSSKTLDEQNPAKKARQCAAANANAVQLKKFIRVGGFLIPLAPLASNDVPQPLSSADSKPSSSADAKPSSSADTKPLLLFDTKHSSSADTKRRNWHRTCAVSFHKSFGNSAKSCKECVETDKTYNAHWCSVCWKEGMEKNGSPILSRFKTCKTHRREYLQKDCPCGRRWTDCLDCKDRGVDLRAGTAFCNTCRKRYGGGGIDFCYCKA